MKRFIYLILCFSGVLISSKSHAQDYTFKWNGHSAQFANEVTGLVSYIDFGDATIWGYMEVTLSGGFSHQNTTGCYRKRYDIGRNGGSVFHSNTSEVLAAFGPVAAQWKLGELQIDAANHLILPLYHLVSTANSVIVNINGLSVTSVNTAAIQITTPQVLANNQSRDYKFTLEPMAIGTNKIETDTKLTVGGKVAAREIKVSVNAGADFVFEPDYKLPALAELEQFVKTNKHLPEIPTAQQMVKDGVNLGELNIKLLQKVEELTLHLIEKDKELKQEKEKNQSQEDRILRLEALMKIKK
ncbi:hypothetical protein [Pedobacter sp. KBW01]|uniref:hypothetical protein n=1 Tax=Pedobacter sp. KBW01 TaxID=2153364 RepID=UPI000F5AF754|nr:hypothetical protein [Pedobacter sp. KBW01]